jgi:hypothetical protein
MNTVLDDNKKLCLNSGEIIQMSNSMNMIFEVQDLLVASPATVSRCGMVYVEPSQVGWRPLQTSWMATLPPALEEHKPRLQGMFDWLLDPCLRFLRKNCRELVPTSDINLAVSLMNLFVCQADAFQPPPEVAGGKKGKKAGGGNSNPKEEAKAVRPSFINMFLFSWKLLLICFFGYVLACLLLSSHSSVREFIHSSVHSRSHYPT